MSNLALIIFEPQDDGFIASVPIEHLEYLGECPETRLQEACRVYGLVVAGMRELLAELNGLKAKRIPIPARKMWRLGDIVLALTNELAQYSLKPDGLNEQLVRDLGINRKRLGTVGTFRKHLSDPEIIPDSLKWSQCEKRARKVAQELKAALPQSTGGPQP